MSTDLVPHIPPDDAEELPCLPGLTPMQSRFVRCYVEHGDGNATRAALAAGYASSSAHAVGYRLLRKQEVLDAIHRLTLQAVGVAAPQALRTMVQLLSHPSGYVRQQAAADLLDRAGFKPPDKHQHLVAGQVSIRIDLGD